MDTGMIALLFGLAALFLGGGIVILVFSIKAFNSSKEPDIRVGSGGRSAQVGKKGLPVFIAIGIGLCILGIVMLVNAIRGAVG